MEQYSSANCIVTVKQDKAIDMSIANLRRSVVEKWEYCVLYGIGPTDKGKLCTYDPNLYRFTSKGYELVTDFKNRTQSITEEISVARVIALLGDEGWELVGIGNGLWFKRPKPIDPIE